MHAYIHAIITSRNKYLSKYVCVYVYVHAHDRVIEAYMIVECRGSKVCIVHAA